MNMGYCAHNILFLIKGKASYFEVAHEHGVVTCAVKARLVGNDAISFLVVLELVMTA